MRNMVRGVYVLVLGVLLASCAAPTADVGVTTVLPATPYPLAPAASPYPSIDIDEATPYPDTPVEAPLNPYPAPTGQQPWSPQPGDAALQRSEAYIETAQVLTLESMPPQFRLEVKGELPTPCHQLRVDVPAPDANQQIDVQVYSVVNPDMICTQVLVPFEASVPLTGLPAGAYTVLVNGQPAGSISVP